MDMNTLKQSDDGSKVTNHELLTVALWLEQSLAHGIHSAKHYPQRSAELREVIDKVIVDHSEMAVGSFVDGRRCAELEDFATNELLFVAFLSEHAQLMVNELIIALKMMSGLTHPDELSEQMMSFNDAFAVLVQLCKVIDETVQPRNKD